MYQQSSDLIKWDAQCYSLIFHSTLLHLYYYDVWVINKTSFDNSNVTTSGEGEFEPGSPYKEDSATPLDYKALAKW